MSASPTLIPQSGEIPWMFDSWASLRGWKSVYAQRVVPIILLKV